MRARPAAFDPFAVSLHWILAALLAASFLVGLYMVDLHLDRAARTGKADVTVDVATVSVTVPSLEGVLKGERLLNVAQNPSARFVGDSFTFEGDKVAAVAGTLTIMGKSQPATLKATHFNCYENNQLKRQVCGGDFETTIQRSQFGLGGFAAVAPDDVRLLIQIEAIHQ